MKKDNKKNKRIAVVGGGVFGCTAAIKFKEAGYDVDLFEKEDEIFKAASGINQYRFHRGYHYPRSKDTVNTLKLSIPLFKKEYGDCLIDHYDHYYAIAKEDSKITGRQFLDFCDELSLEYKIESPDFLSNDMFDLVVFVEESIIDPIKLKHIILDRIKKTGVNLFLNSYFNSDMIDGYDLVINATYANLNAIFQNKKEFLKEYQFEVCE